VREAFEQLSEAVDLASRKRRKQVPDARVDKTRGRSVDASPGLAKRQRLAAPVVRRVRAFDPAGLVEDGDELRDGSARDAGTACELRGVEVFRCNCPQREELRRRQWWVVCRQDALDPAAHERRHAYERLGCIDGPARTRHSKVRLTVKND
jgi:hypothetical protein